MTERNWVYFANERSEEWGYQVGVLDFFLGDRDPGRHIWILSATRHHFHDGDLIWVRAVEPLGAFVGVGRVRTEPDWVTTDKQYVFDVEWYDDMCRRMASDPIRGVLEKHTQSVRELTQSELSTLLKAVGSQLPAGPGAHPDPPPVQKVRRSQDVLMRQGQPRFRATLMNAYERRCAVTGTDVPEVLQAAHIIGYAESGENATRNGLLLRSDIHDLFDRGLLWISAASKVAVAPELRASDYGKLNGKALRLPRDRGKHPDPQRLARHRREIAMRSA
jgi:hypothetical protein